jgi:hypothetical protein
MTAAGGRSALQGAGAAGTAADPGAAARTARAAARRLQAVLSLARVEALTLVRSPLVLGGMCAGAVVVWVRFGPAEPVWWNAAWQIGEGQLVLAMAVLIAAQQAAGRARRDGLHDLYASFPATAGTRAIAQLAGLAGALPASLLLIAAAAAVAQWRGAIGVPSIAVLAGGVLLVLVAGAVGTAVGIRFPHPLAGVLAAIVLFVPIEQNNLPGPVTMLFPWKISLQLSVLPGPLAGFPPAGAHAAELAGIAVAAGIAALAMTVRGARARSGLAAAAAAALAVIVAAGVVQLRPVPTAELNRLVAAAVRPAAVEQCTTASQVRYCLYPGFGRLRPSLEAPVSAVLSRLPARPGSQLTLSQVTSLYLPDDTLTHGHSTQQVARWEAQLRTAPGNVGRAAVIYLPVGSWPAGGSRLADAQFDVALATAEWAVRIPPQAIGSLAGEEFMACVPLNQAREAIAVWLAILATRPPAAELRSGLGGPGTGSGFAGVGVRNTIVTTWAYPGSSASYVTPPSAPQTTAAGYLLARAMTSLPEHKVIRILSGEWMTWLNWHTTDAQLAGALGIRAPRPPAFPAPGTGGTTGPGPAGPQNPVCTS